MRNLCYRLSLFPCRSLGAPVVSVGNITVGGTGKTPLVEKIAAQAMARSLKPCVLARGYKSRAGSGEPMNDEAMMLTRKIPGLALGLSPNRVAAAKKVLSRRPIDFFILDDGFQHRKVERDLDMVVVDATCPFGYGRVLPAGLLREPLSGLARAQVILLSRCDLVDSRCLAEIEARLARMAPRTPVFRTAHTPSLLRSLDGTAGREPTSLSGTRVFLFSAIAQPAAFEGTVQALGAEVMGHRVFPDHHWYSKADLQSVLDQAAACRADQVVTTAKDGAKLTRLQPEGDLLVLEVELEFLGNEKVFWDLVFGKVASPA